MQPPTIASVYNPVSQSLPLLPDLSQTIDWTALLNEDPPEPTHDPILPRSYVNSALPDIDLSVPQLEFGPRSLREPLDQCVIIGTLKL